jgi:outer membrane lipoprotein-sorting protein
MKVLSAATVARGIALAATVFSIGAAAPSSVTPPPAAGMTAEQWFAKFQTAWNGVNTYTAKIATHEALNGKAQDRVYTIDYQKPTSVRLDITGGDGKGSAAVWQGGDTVRGHQGGFFSMIKLNLNIHAHLATSLRGTTIAQSYFGAQLDHLKSVKWKSTDVTVNGDNATITAIPADPTQDDGIVKEVMTLGANGLPVELIQYDGPDSLAKDVKYSEVKLNVDLPPSTWQI